MEHGKVLDLIETISLKLQIEEDPAKIQKGLSVIHGLALHRNVALIEPEVTEFLAMYSEGEPES